MKNSKRHKITNHTRAHSDKSLAGKPKEQIWMYGQHAVLAALNNPQRKLYKLIVTSKNILTTNYPIEPEVVDKEVIEKNLPPGAVHQGIALLSSPLAKKELEDILGDSSDQSILIVIDQANDPHNIGAVIRSAAAFKADAVIVPERYTPQSTAKVAKSASGALEKIPLIRVANLSRTLDHLKNRGYWCAGLTADAEETIAGASLSGKIVLVLGAEGRGLRRLTKDKCDYLIRIPIDENMNSLNLSAAAAIALYELKRI